MYESNGGGGPPVSGCNAGFLVLGVGNIMMGDEGLGVIAVRRLLDEFTFPPAVVAMEGGVGGLSLLAAIRSAARIVIIDAVKANAMPGSIFIFDSEEVEVRREMKASLHDVGILEVMKTASLLGGCPPATVIGVQPGEMGEFGAGLTKMVESSMPLVVKIVVELLTQAGFEPQPRQAAFSPLP